MSEAAGAVTHFGSPPSSRRRASASAAGFCLRRSMRNVVSRLATRSLPPSAEFPRELGRGKAVPRLHEPEIRLPLPLGEVFPVAPELEEGPVLPRGAPHAAAEAFPFALQRREGGVGVLRNC